MKSLLFVPSKEKMLSKVESFSADAFIVDLEDSVAEAEKDAALDAVCLFLESNPTKKIYVRLNGNRLEKELLRLEKYGFKGFMIPKFENPNSYKQFESFFREKEVIALVETPQGLLNIGQIACCNFVDAIAFGAEDFTSYIGMKNSPETLYYARTQIVTAAKAFNKKVYDTPSFAIDNTERLESEIQAAVDLGFDGKLAIHPGQIGPINKLFQVSDIDYIKGVVEMYEKSGEAVLRIDDKVYEKMHIAHFKRIIKEHDSK